MKQELEVQRYISGSVEKVDDLRLQNQLILQQNSLLLQKVMMDMQKTMEVQQDHQTAMHLLLSGGGGGLFDLVRILILVTLIIYLLGGFFGFGWNPFGSFPQMFDKASSYVIELKDDALPKETEVDSPKEPVEKESGSGKEKTNSVKDNQTKGDKKASKNNRLTVCVGDKDEKECVGQVDESQGSDKKADKQ